VTELTIVARSHTARCRLCRGGIAHVRLIVAVGDSFDDRRVEASLHLKPFSAIGEKRLKHGRQKICGVKRSDLRMLFS
jgi:hypothetical protein